MKRTCNQCQSEMQPVYPDAKYDGISQSLSICLNPKCPNYTLVQVPIEQILSPNDLKERDKNPFLIQDWIAWF